MNELKGNDLAIAWYDISMIELPSLITFVIFTQGCNINCDGCHNPELHPATKGNYTVDEVLDGLSRKPKHMIDAIVIMGGEPLMQDLDKLKEFILRLKSYKPVALFTSYDFKDVPKDILDIIDFVKCGRYERDMRTVGFPITSNQEFYIKEDREWKLIKEKQ